MNRPLKNIFDRMEVVCQIKPCSLQGKIIKHEELVVHAKNCPTKTVECPLGCKEVLDSGIKLE